MRDELCTVADAQHGHAAHKLAQVYLEGFRVVHTEGRTAEDDANDRWVVLRELVVGQDFAEGVELAHAASDELCGLRSEVEDNDFLLHEKY